MKTNSEKLKAIIDQLQPIEELEYNRDGTPKVFRYSSDHKKEAYKRFAVAGPQVQHLKEGLIDTVKAWDFQPISGLTDTFAIYAESEVSKSIIDLEQALASKEAVITEVDESGDVNALKVQNKSLHYLLIYEGSLLEGEKQNRIVNTSMLIAPKTEQIIPVSCVEQGRWARKSETFSKPKHDANYGVRRSLKRQVAFSKKGFDSRQSEVWNEVSKFSNAEGLSNSTQDYSDMYRQSSKERFVFPEGLKVKSHGLFVSSKGEAYADFVGQQEVSSPVLERVSKGYEQGGKEGARSVEDPCAFFLNLIEKANNDILIQEAIGEGHDVRLETEAHYISSLLVDGEFVAFSICNK